MLKSSPFLSVKHFFVWTEKGHVHFNFLNRTYFCFNNMEIAKTRLSLIVDYNSEYQMDLIYQDVSSRVKAKVSTPKGKIWQWNMSQMLT